MSLAPMAWPVASDAIPGFAFEIPVITFGTPYDAAIATSAPLGKLIIVISFQGRNKKPPEGGLTICPGRAV
jgi:hypothetical protein